MYQKYSLFLSIFINLLSVKRGCDYNQIILVKTDQNKCKNKCICCGKRIRKKLQRSEKKWNRSTKWKPKPNQQLMTSSQNHKKGLLINDTAWFSYFSFCASKDLDYSQLDHGFPKFTAEVKSTTTGYRCHNVPSSWVQRQPLIDLENPPFP